MEFNPKVGDFVEFESDRQVDNGPWTGTVEIVTPPMVAISYHGGDRMLWREASKIKVRKYVPMCENLRTPRPAWFLV
jgi:hypothetical protein